MKHHTLSSAWHRALRSSAAISVLAVALAAGGGASAQQGGQGGSRPAPVLSDAPIPKSDAAAIVKRDRLVESEKPVREMIKNWRKPVKVVVVGIDNTHRLAWLQEAAPGVKLVPVANNAELKKEIVDADVLFGGGCNKDLVMAGKELRWVQQEHTGIEECFTGTVPPQLASGTVVVSNNKGVHAGPIAFHAIALMSSLARGIDVFSAQRQTGKLDKRELAPDRLWVVEGRTMLVVGLGGIGTDIAQLGHALGMKVIATRNSSHDGPPFVSYVGLANELPNLVGQADVVVVASPLTKETEGMFNAAIFNRMKKGALFVNIAREGEVVDADLASALASGQVGGAGLDGDPSGWKATNPLFKAPNVILTPHIAGNAVDTPAAGGGEDTWVYMRENLRRYVNGEKLLSVVNPKLGY